MSYKIINVPIKNNQLTHRHYCGIFQNVILTHKDNCPNPSSYLEVYQNTKQIIFGFDWGIQSNGDINKVYGELEKSNDSFDYEIKDDVFLFHDDAGGNYIHFFFNYLSRLVYFEELKKQNPKLKLGIISDYYNNTDTWSFIKQWLELQYDESVEVLVFEKDKTYKLESLIISNCFYGFPEPFGMDPMLDMIKSVTDKINPIKVKSNGCYISRQDTIKRGWYHKRELQNELELIERIKSELNYDIIEMMDYTLEEKIQLSKSYKNIIQQSSASNINILFSNPNTNNIIISNPKMGNWLNEKCQIFSTKSGSNLLILEGAGEIVLPDETPQDRNNYPWKLTDIDGIIDVLKQVEDDIIW